MNVICKIFGHKHKITRCIEPLAIYELKCKRCGAVFGYNRQIQALLPLDDKLIAAHYDILKFRGVI